MNKIETKKFFWKLVNAIEECDDTQVKNDKGVVTERGMLLSNDYSVMFGLDDGVIRIYDKDYKPLIAFTENSEVLLILKELFEDLEL